MVLVTAQQGFNLAEKKSSINLLTVSEVADLTGRHAETVRRWIRDGNLEAHTLPYGGRAGHEYRIRERDLLDFLRNRHGEGEEA